MEENTQGMESKYGTQFIETEILLAVINGDVETLNSLCNSVDSSQSLLVLADAAYKMSVLVWNAGKLRQDNEDTHHAY